MKTNQKIVLFLALFLSVSVTADALIAAYPHASLVEKDDFLEKDYRIATGSVDVVNNAVRVSKELRMDVSGQSYLFRLAEGYTSKNAIDFVTDQFKNHGAEVLYACSSRGCGDSNSWANVIFRKSKLYGKEIDQNYIAAKFSKLPGAPIVLAYSARRGNGQVFLYIEELVDPNASIAEDAGEPGGAVKLLATFHFDQPNGTDIALTKAELSDIVQQVDDSGVLVWVVSHYIRDGNTLGVALENSQLALDGFVRQLAMSGVNVASIKGVTVGAFAKIDRVKRGTIEVYSEKNSK